MLSPGHWFVPIAGLIGDGRNLARNPSTTAELSPMANAAPETIVPSAAWPRAIALGKVAPPWLWQLLAGLLVFVGLLVWHSNVLRLPPYEDQAVGLWTEADFLAESGFDYYRLRYGENHYMSANAGPRSYMISVLPTIVALLMIGCPSVASSIFVAHLLTLACTSAICLVLAAIARAWCGAIGAALVCGAVLTTPLFNAQVQMVGMEIPLTLFALLATWAMWRERFLLAAGFSMLAFLMKATGGLFTFVGLAYLSALIALAGTSTPGTRDRRYLRGWVAFLVLLLLQTALVRIGDTTIELRRQINWPAALRLPFAVEWCPDMVVLFAVCAVLTAAVWLTDAEQLRRAAAAERLANYWRARAADAYRRHANLVICWAIVLGMIAANSLYIFMPRYFTCATPYLWLILGVLLFERLRVRKVAMAVFVLLIAFNVVNRNGDYFPAIEQAGAESFRQHAWIHARSCPFTERSNEYLADHLSQIEVMRKLDREYHDHPILVALPQKFYLTKPRLGYVASPLKTYDASRPEEIARAVDDWQRSGQPQRDPIYFWYGATRATLPLPGQQDQVLYFDGQSTPIIVYRKHWPSK